jgi:hypothetical protein
MEELPFCITNQLNMYNWTTPKYDNVFISKNEVNAEIIVYNFTESVNWLPDEKNINSVNIYEKLLRYQDKIINDNSLLFFHDFTGRDASELAVIMDSKLGENKKYVMYDISVRQNIGCYVNLDDNIPIVYLTDKLEIVNPYNIKDIYSTIHNLKNDLINVHIIIKQLMIVIKNKINEWDSIVSLYRQMLSQDAKTNNLDMTNLNKEFNKEVKDAYVIYQASLQKEHLDYCINLSRNSIIMNLRNILDMLSNNNNEKNIYIQKCELQLSETLNLYTWSNEIKEYLNTKLLLL